MINYVTAQSQISADSKQLFIFEYFPFQAFRIGHYCIFYIPKYQLINKCTF